MNHITEDGRTRRYARWRRRLVWTTAAVAVVHALLLAFLAFPDPADRSSGEPTLTVVPMPPVSERRQERDISPPGEGGPEGERAAGPERLRDRATRPDQRPSIPVMVETPGAPEETTIPSTALEDALRAPTLPLEAGPEGVRRRAPDAGTLARMRAESLVNARLADLPGAKRGERRPVDLAEGGGVTIAIPWQGFLPENRRDETWREERCEGKDGGENDKPGEAEGRAGQCG